MKKEEIMTHLNLLLCDPLIYLIYNRSRAGEFDALHQCFLVQCVIIFLKY